MSKPLMMISAMAAGMMYVMQSYVKLDTQYAGMDTPEISCWCFADTSRSRTMNTMNAAGMNAMKNTIMMAANRAPMRWLAWSWSHVLASGSLYVCQHHTTATTPASATRARWIRCTGISQ